MRGRRSFIRHPLAQVTQRLAHGAWTCVMTGDMGVTDGHKRPRVGLRNTDYYISQDDAASSVWASEMTPQG